MEVLRDRELQDGPHLVLQNEEGKDTFVALSEPITIGRRTSNALQILDPTVSREHVRVSYGDGSGWVETWAAHTGRSSTTSASRQGRRSATTTACVSAAPTAIR